MAVEYGFITKDIKENDLVKIISKQLELFFAGKSKYDIYKNHNLIKHKNSDGDSFNPDKIEWNYEYSYEYFNKPFGVFLELYPNTNSEGGMKFKEEGVVWNLYVNDIVWSENSGTFLWDGKPCDKHPAISKLIPFILEGIPCEAVLIKEYEENEERL